MTIWRATAQPVQLRQRAMGPPQNTPAGGVSPAD